MALAKTPDDNPHGRIVVAKRAVDGGPKPQWVWTWYDRRGIPIARGEYAHAWPGLAVRDAEKFKDHLADPDNARVPVRTTGYVLPNGVKGKRGEGVECPRCKSWVKDKDRQFEAEEGQVDPVEICPTAAARDRVEVYKVDHGWDHPYPWMFRVHFGGKTFQYAGVPNQCATRREAAARAGWRLRWLRLGVHDTKYG